MRFNNKDDFDNWILNNYPDLVRFWFDKRIEIKNLDTKSLLKMGVRGLRRYNIKKGQIYLQAFNLDTNSLTVLYIYDLADEYLCYQTTITFKMRMKMGKIQKIWNGEIKWSIDKTIPQIYKAYGNRGYWFLYYNRFQTLNWMNDDPLEVKG